MDKPFVQLSGRDGNAFAIIANTTTEIKKWNRQNPDNRIDIEKFQKEATSGDYDHLIQTVMKYCEVA